MLFLQFSETRNQPEYCSYLTDFINEEFDSTSSDDNPVIYVFLIDSKRANKLMNFWIYESSNYPSETHLPSFYVKSVHREILFYDYRFVRLQKDSVHFSTNQQVGIFSQNSKSVFIELKKSKNGFTHVIKAPNSVDFTKISKRLTKRYK